MSGTADTPEHLTLDLTRPERSAAMAESTLRDLECGPVQIAVIQQLIWITRTDEADGLPTIRLSQRAAAGWIARNLDIAGGRCEPTSVRKAWQWWRDQGVLIVIPGRRCTTVKIHWDRLRDWCDEQQWEQPLFEPIARPPEPAVSPHRAEPAGTPFDPQPKAQAPAGDSRLPVVTGGDSRLPPVTGGDSRLPPVTGGDSQRRREEEEEDLYIPPPSQSPPSAQQQQQLVTPEVQSAVERLPDLPDVAFSPRVSDSRLLDELNRWAQQHGLRDQLGPIARDVYAAVIGLLLNARGKGSPEAYYAACVRNGIQTRAQRRGRTWIREHARAEPAR